MTENWIQDQIKILKSYEGSRVERAMIYEMAMTDDESGAPIFRHPSFPFIQAYVVYLWLDNGKITKIHTYQNDCEWELHSTTLENTWELNVKQEDDSIFRLSECDDFPVGIIELVSIRLNEQGDISGVKFVIGGHEILLTSGEVYQNFNGSISVKNDDESVLVFLNPEDVAKVKFNA
jgi:hypothetical protein